MRKGQKKRIWTPEQKLEMVKKHLEEHISVRTLEKEYGVVHSMVCRRTKEYIAGGEAGLHITNGVAGREHHTGTRKIEAC